LKVSQVVRPITKTRLSLYEHAGGVETKPGNHVVYDLLTNHAHFGAADVPSHALVWEVGDEGLDAQTSVLASIPANTQWLLRCDRVDFPPGGVAHRHIHPGPGIRRLLFGELRIESPEGVGIYGEGDAWFEGRDQPVLATASKSEDTAFVRVLLLPAEWAGKRTIRYLDPADEGKPKLQRAQVLLEVPVEL
jgi:quercetin dioxygenase-like cupin family protein